MTPSVLPSIFEYRTSNDGLCRVSIYLGFQLLFCGPMFMLIASNLSPFSSTGKIYAKLFVAACDVHVCQYLNLDMVFTIDIKRRANLLHVCSENGGREAQCHLLVSDSHVGEAPRLRFIYQRWLLQILTIEGSVSFHC